MENEIKRLKQELDKKKNKRFSNVNVMDYLVIICIVTVIAFVVVNLYYYYIKDIPPTSELMGYFFAFFGGELLAMAGITISKHRRDKGRDDQW